MTRVWGAAAACALAAGRALAQETQLPTLSVEASANEGFFGETFAQSAGSVMKTDTPILDTPRSVSVVTQQQIQDRGARSLVDSQIKCATGYVRDRHGTEIQPPQP
jgi:iron complex outermembrane receptor protein